MKYLILILVSFLVLEFQLNFVESCGGYLPTLKQRTKIIGTCNPITRTYRCIDKDGKSSTCTKRSRVTRTKVVLEDYWVTFFGCCNQYEEISPGICKPVCHSCKNGICSAPDVCICNKGYLKNPDNSQCEPVCGENCINSNSTSTNDNVDSDSEQAGTIMNNYEDNSGSGDYKIRESTEKIYNTNITSGGNYNLGKDENNYNANTTSCKDETNGAIEISYNGTINSDENDT